MNDQQPSPTVDRPWATWDANTAAALLVLVALALLVAMRLGLGPVTILTR